MLVVAVGDRLDRALWPGASLRRRAHGALVDPEAPSCQGRRRRRQR